MTIVATVGGVAVPESAVDDREAALRAGPAAAALPRRGTSEGRQLRRWLTQLLVTERVVAAEAASRGLAPQNAPGEDDLLPDNAARLEIGSVAAAVLSDPLARAVFADVTAAVDVTAAEVTDYHARNPLRFATGTARNGWTVAPTAAPAVESVRQLIETHLRGAARRRAFRHWLDARCAESVSLAGGYEHPGDPRQPDNTHRH
jgi:[acyl-carrier-protein] S-malonyltransferase